MELQRLAPRPAKPFPAYIHVSTCRKAGAKARPVQALWRTISWGHKCGRPLMLTRSHPLVAP